MTKKHLTEQKFSDFNVHPALLQVLTCEGFEYCTPVQAHTLPVVLAGQDIIAQAQTGTGKTLAFLTATLHYLLTHASPPERRINQPRALIIAPTRELAVQIHANAMPLACATGLKLGLAYGGEGYQKQLAVLALGVDVLIGTTGRLIDYLKQAVINLEQIQLLVLDEADRLCDINFIKDLRYLLRPMPKPERRRTLLFSATLSCRVHELAFEQTHDACCIEVEPDQKITSSIREELFYPSSEDKMVLLQTLIEQEWPDRCIIFANTKQCCEMLWGYLSADGHRVGLLTGDVPQKKRLMVLDDFSSGRLDLLVATDVAARGLHIPAVTHVFNYDLPDDYQDYVHRIGRTGRIGASGHAISFACEVYAINLPAIETYIAHSLPVSQYNPEALLRHLPVPKKIHRNNKGRRGSNQRSRQA